MPLPTTFVCMAIVLLLVGFFAPSFSIIPSVGDDAADALLHFYFPEMMETKTFSIVGSIWSLFVHGELGLAIILLVFSVLFPLLKNVVLLVLFCNFRCFGFAAQKSKSLALWFLTTFGSWSMLDVFVVAVVLVSFKEFPGGTTLVRHWGIFCFACSVLCTMMATSMVKPIIQDTQSAQSQGKQS